jgi:hypothetical protein
MQSYYFFYGVFLSQILIISFYFPRKLLRQMRWVVNTYPPSTHPLLYTKPIEMYENARRRYRNLNGFLLIIGLLILGALMRIDHDNDLHNAIAMGYFFAQMIPVILLDFSSLSEFKRMRSANTKTTRKADLRPRRLTDFISRPLLSAAVITYVAFIALIVYIDQFNYDWFGGYVNLAGISLVNALFAGISYWHTVGKKLNPHESADDRATRIATVAKIMALTSIAATVFVSITIALSMFEVRYLLSVALSVYFQLLAIVGFQAYRIKYQDFDVYKENPLRT